MGIAMEHREEWKPVLEAEVKRWRAQPFEQLIAELQEERVYEIEFGGRTYQVEVEILENTDSYIRVVVSVDDGSVPASFRPLSESFIRNK